jgi:hypothetical protein
VPYTLEEGTLSSVVVGVEYNLGTNPKIISTVAQVIVDLSNMEAGDVTEIRIYRSAKSGADPKVVEIWIAVGAQGRPIFVSPPIIFTPNWRVTLKQTAGTGRSYDWSIVTP